MVKEYAGNYYVPAVTRWRELTGHGAQKARELSEWRARVKGAFGEVTVKSFEARGDPGLPEVTFAVVEVEQVADARVVGREAGDRARDRARHVRVSRDEDVRAAVAVHVGDRRTRIPAVRGGENARPEAVGAVPQHLDARGGRDDEVGTTVPV